MDKGLFQIIVIILFVVISVLTESLKKRNKQKTPAIPPRRRTEPPRSPAQEPVFETTEHEPHETAWWEVELKRLEREAEEVQAELEPAREPSDREAAEPKLPLLRAFQPPMQLRGLSTESRLTLSTPLKGGARLQRPGKHLTHPHLFQARNDLKQAILMAELLLPPVALRDSTSAIQSVSSAPGSSSQP
ncbi:MAG TPA: hypothetical protein PKA37_11290 [Planctomycetota bacterium]|jgi:hypothetical protein|nr:hypothetical protein [Planctomycetota bacterium]